MPEDGYISEKNAHIEDLLTAYISPSVGAEYAFLLKAEWGSGKTWFIDRFIQKYGDSSEFKFVRCSLYGLHSIDEIYVELFRQMNPTKHKFDKGVFGKVIHAASNSSIMGFKVDISSMAISDPKDLDLNDQRYVFVFDDIERTHVQLEYLMGFFNQLVEIEHQKLILIGDEKRLEKKFKDESHEEFSYDKIREKLIGKSCYVQPEVNAVVMNTLEHVLYRKHIESDVEAIVEIYDVAGHKNLRHLIYALNEFDWIYESFTESIKENTEMVSHLFKVFFILVIEYRAGTLDKEMLKNVDNYRYWFKLFSEEEDKKDEDQERFKDIADKYRHYGFFQHNNFILSGDIWQRIIDEYLIDADKINHLIEMHAADVEVSDWVKLTEFRAHTEETFAEIIRQVEEGLESSKYIELGEILQIVSSLMFYSKKGVYGKSLEDIKLIGISVFDKLSEKGEFKSYAKKQTLFVDIRGAFGGYVYMSQDFDEFKEFMNYIGDRLPSLSEDSQKEKARGLEKILLTAPKEMTVFLQDDEFDFMTLPFLKHIDPQIITNMINKFCFEEHYQFYKFLEERYSRGVKVLVEEKDFLEGLKVLMEEASSSGRHTVSKLTYKFYVEIIDNALSRLDAL